MDDKLEIRMLNLDDLQQWRENAKLHDIGAIITSLEKYGYKNPMRYEPTLNDSTGGIVAGNGRVEALRAMKSYSMDAPRGIVVQDGNWYVPVLFGVDAHDEKEAWQFGIDDNNIGMMGGDLTPLTMSDQYDKEKYLEILMKVKGSVSVDGDDLDLLIQERESRPSHNQLEDSNNQLEDDDGNDTGDLSPTKPSDGSLLNLLEITIDEPKHQVEKGDVYLLSGKHMLICGEVVKDTELWSAYLDDCDLFIPYAGPMIALSKKADSHTLLLVQPNTYICGHILDRYTDIYGENSVRKY